jgi:hypothetical protein
VIASIVVVISQWAPIVVSAVAVHGPVDMKASERA